MTKNVWLLDEVARLLGIRSKKDNPALDVRTRPLEQLVTACSVLMSDTLGEGSTREIADWAMQCYQQLQDDEKTKFFFELRESYSVNEAALEDTFQAWRQEKQDSQLHKIFQAAEPPRQQLLRKLNYAQGATYRIVMMRADLRRIAKTELDLKPLDLDFKHLLSSWFNPGFLTMREIPWGSAKELEQFLMEHERVHPMADRAELRRRMAPRDRYIYGFFHPAIGQWPLIFVEVALTQGVPATIEAILENRKAVQPGVADTAVFYSINNSFDGLAGISFGSFLIKQVIEAVRKKLPQLSTFVTFSPIPGFRQWLENENDVATWRHLKEDLALNQNQTKTSEQDNISFSDTETERAIQQAVAHYLVKVKRQDDKPIDPVGRFHLGNGASVCQIHWPGSAKPYSIDQSYGAMVSYQYDPDELERNHELFVRHGRVATSVHIDSILNDDQTPAHHDERYS